MAAKRLLVGSVYAPSDRNPTWLALQKRFLGEFTGVDYDLGVYLNRTDPGPFEEASALLVGRSFGPSGPWRTNSPGWPHPSG